MISLIINTKKPLAVNSVWVCDISFCANNNGFAMVWVIEDWTDQIRREAQLDRAKADAEAASRAIYQCQPYRLPADRYNLWRQIKPLRFDPRQMMGQ